MLGNVDPTKVRVVALAPVVYSGHDNLTVARFTQVIDSGLHEVTLDFSDLTRIILTFPGTSPLIVFDSAELDGVIDWSQGSGLIEFDLSTFDIPENSYRAELVIYDAEHPRGQVLVTLDAPQNGLVLRFDQVNGAGGVPLPVWPDFAADVRAVVLTGLSTLTSTAISAADSVLGAFGKLQAQITARALKGANSDITSLTGLTTPLSVEQGGTGQATALTPADLGAATAAQGATADTAVQPGDLATVATTGSYTDLTDQPSIPNSADDIGAATAAQGATAATAVQPGDLATVATSGSYTDLSNTPSIPDTPDDIGAATAAQGATADSAVQPGDLAAVATSGSYSDLLDPPAIPNSPDDINAATAAQGALADTAVQPGDLATVATSGAYTDLLDPPAIPNSPDDIGAATAAQGAKADTAVQPGALATVATTGQYSDLLSKPSIPSTPADIGAATAAQGATADTAVQTSALGVTVATLVSGTVPSSQLPSYVDDAIEAANFAALPGTGESGKIYVLDTPYTVDGMTSAQFRWSGSAYAPIIASPGSTDAVTEGSTNLYFSAARVLATLLAGLSTASSAVISTADSVLSALGKLQAQHTSLASSVSNVDNTSDANKPVSTAQQTALDLKANLAGPTFTGTVSGISKSMVGLSNVDNTSDAAKPVSTATQTALDLKANLAGPTFTGTVSGISKSMVGLGSVDNTADTAKPVSTAQQTALDLKITNPMTTSGDTLYGGASGVPTRLAKGSNGQWLTLASGLPAWSDLPAAAVPTVNGKTGAVIVSAPIIVACSDETTALTAGTSKVSFRMPYAFTVTGVRASLVTAQTSGSIFTVDINESGTSIISTKLTIDNTENTSQTAATPPVISDTALADDAIITVDIDQIGDGTAKGLKITLIGYQP
jgi:hypothetical protein